MKMPISRLLLLELDITMLIFLMVLGHQADLVSSSSPEEMVGWMSGITSTDKTKLPLVIKFLILL